MKPNKSCFNELPICRNATIEKGAFAKVKVKIHKVKIHSIVLFYSIAVFFHSRLFLNI